MKTAFGNSLVVQWLGLGAFTAKGLDSIPGQGTKIPQASLCSQIKKKDFGDQVQEWELRLSDPWSMSFPPSQHPSVAWGFLPYKNSRAP